MKEVKKLGLALGGGGARGFCHIGVLEVLQENNIPIDIITGCSMGALVGGLAVADIPVSQMRKIAEEITTRKVFDIDLNLVKSMKKGLAKGNRAMKIYDELVGDKRIEDCKIPFAAISTDLVSARLHVFRTGLLTTAVRASMAIPGVFHPMEERGMVLVDGGVLKRVPISEARELGADVVIAVDALGEPRGDLKINSVLRIIERSFLLMDWKTAKADNNTADITLCPYMGDKPLYMFKDNKQAIDAGRESAQKALPQILKLLKKKKIMS